MHTADAPARLARFLAVAYALLIVYACLHPFTGWRVTGLPLFDYLFAPWPKYFRVEDLVLNVLGYLPLGFVTAAALASRCGRSTAVAVATILTALLSFSIETTQNFLPSRISSNIDLGSNLLGGLSGAVLGALWGHHLFEAHSGLQRWRTERIIAGRTGDLGLILLGLWLLAQHTPESILFSSGDLRHILRVATPLPFDAERFITLEAALVASSMLAIGLLARCMMLSTRSLSLVLLLLLAVAAKSLATQFFFVPGSLTTWVTPGTRYGLAVGSALLACALLMPRIHQHALAGTATLIAATLANLIPVNPYLAVGQALLGHGNFLNFHGLTQFVAGIWPFLALAYLSALGLWRGDHLHEG